MAVFQKDEEVYAAVSDLRSKVNRLWEKTGLAAEDKKAADEAEAAAAKAEADKPSEQPASAPAPAPEPAKTESEAKPATKSGGAAR